MLRALAPFRPRTLSIPKLGVVAPVLAVATAANGDFDVPADPTTVGWWWPGGQPGGQGNTVIAGHVDSRRLGQGALFRLHTLRVGDLLVLAGPGDVGQDYQVARSHTIVKSALPTSIFAMTGSPMLVVVTCGGPFDHTTGHYRDNVVVYAKPV